MHLFTIDKRILDELNIENIEKFDQKNPHFLAHHYLSPHAHMTQVRGHAWSLNDYIAQLENIVGDRQPGRMIIFTEILKNAYQHGEGSRHGATTATIISRKGLAIGCHDGGPYLFKQENKLAWESGEKIPHHNYSKGQQFMRNSGTVKIDAKQGVLYYLELFKP